jgi:hypothetical protein
MAVKYGSEKIFHCTLQYCLFFIVYTTQLIKIELQMIAFCLKILIKISTNIFPKKPILNHYVYDFITLYTI